MRKGPILYLIIAITGLMIGYFRLKKTLIGITFFLLITILTIQYFPKYKNINRFQDLLNVTASHDLSSSTVIRKNIYICYIIKIKEKPIFGYGVGNTQSQLDNCYLEKGIDLSLKTYNCHNQFFSILLTSGIVGLLLYLFSIYKILKIFYAHRNFLALSILLLLLLNFLTENVIERENGMIIYSYLLSFFMFYPKSYQHSQKTIKIRV
jgi:O-antigen ligase